MTEILAENLSEKEVMGSDGMNLGTLYNITMDLKTGSLHHVIVDPAERVNSTEFDRDEHGNLLIPFSRVQAVKDNIVVSR
jgi:sporulation protein YlmC with PRC-barrel domain